MTSITSSDFHFLVPESFHTKFGSDRHSSFLENPVQILYVHHLGPRSRNSLDLQYSYTFIYNAITGNNREIDRVHKNELYTATVSIKQKAVDRIKTVLWFWFHATRKSAQMTSKTTTFVTSISDIVMERYVNEQTDEKKMFLHCQSGDIKDSVCGVITIPVVKINKMANSGAPRLRVNELCFW